MKIEIQYEIAGKVRLGTLTTEHSLSSYGLPVLIDEDDNPRGPADVDLLTDFPDDGHVAEYIKSAKAAGYAVPANEQPNKGG